MDGYLNRLVLGGYRPATIRARRFILTAFADWIDVPLRDATRRDVESYLSRDLKPESRRAYRSALRSYYQWATEEGLIAEDPTVRVPPIRVPRAAPRPISDADLALALSRADARMRAWLLLMSLAGLRCLEVAALRPEDLVESGDGFLLHLRETKGGGTAVLPAHPAIVAALAVLPVRDGRWWSCTRGTVSTDTAAYLRSLGVDATAHQLRHFAGTAWFRTSGHDLLTTARLLRHANVATSQRYAQLDPVRPAQVVRAVDVPGA